MDYYKVLANIFKKTNKLILSDEYKTDYTDINSFIRNRKLSFTNCIYFILSSSKKSLASGMTGFIESCKKLQFPDISKQAFSKARQNINLEAFEELCNLVVDTYYQKEKNLNTWHGFNVFAVDGMSLEIPCTDENINHFGAYSNQSKTITSKASASILYDVLNDIIVDSIIGECHASEKNKL